MLGLVITRKRAARRLLACIAMSPQIHCHPSCCYCKSLHRTVSVDVSAKLFFHCCCQGWHNYCPLPVPIRGYHLQTLLTLSWLPYASFSTLFFSSLFPPSPHPPSFLLSPHSYICLYHAPYSCYIGQHCTISTYTGFATLATPRFRYRWRKPQWYSVTFILISGRSVKPLTSSNAVSNHVDVRPASQHRAGRPAALVSAAALDCCWRRHSRFLSRRHTLLSTFSFSSNL